MKNYLIYIMIILAVSSNCFAQDNYEKDFQRLADIAQGKNFIGQIIKGSKNGMGFLVEKNDAFYIGDFVSNKKNGNGLQYFPGDSKLKDYPNATFFVGKWENNKLNGHVKCYNKNGYLVYDGQSENIFKLDSFPEEVDKDKMLSRIENSDGDTYIGETFCGYPSGFGFIIFANGDLWQSNFKDGSPYGIGLLVSKGKEWQTIKFSDSGESSVVSSSMEYASLDEERKNFVNSNLSKALDCFVTAGNIVGNIASGEYKSENTSNANNGAIGLEYSGGKDYSSGSGVNYQMMYSNWERRAKMNYNSITLLGIKVQKNGKDYCGTSGQGAVPATYTQQKKYLREAQAEMKRIRKKAAKAGITIQKSEYEDVTVSY